ncbi:unnamed protein product [Ambrosiozyma monospora]|uniref:Unnamed protein product n=1 Tax=Ambrosiozyma monospora TaxID=43982 RepID=A0ACB5TLI6_AMBMO|nr:unnamed protein product [Ambrosiozyma monospora]
MEYTVFVDSETELRLPSHLRVLQISEVLESDILSDIVNRDQLGQLSSADIHLSGADATGIYTDVERNESVYLRVASFLHELPVLKYLRLSISGNCTKRMIRRLSLNTLDHLVGLSFLISTRNFDLPIYYLPPSCLILQLHAFTTLSERFSETLSTLDIMLHGYTKSFEYFWDRFITPLNNLCCLNLTLADTTEVIDFSSLEFPVHLHTLEFHKYAGKCKFIFGELP